MHKAEREALAARALATSGSGELEAIVWDTESGLTRFTQNAIHQNLAQRDTVLRVRAVVDGRTGVCESNDLGDTAVAATVARARELASLAPRDEDAPGLHPSGQPGTPHGAFVAATAGATPADRAQVAGELIAAAEEAGLWAAGYVTTGRSGITIANSAGTLVSFDGTECGLNVKQNGSDSSGFAERVGNDIALLDGAAAGKAAAAKALLGARPAPVDPGAWTVILEPAAFGELLAPLVDHFSARAFDEGSSFLSDGLGRLYTGTNLTLADDFAHPLFAGRPFDFEGYPTLQLPLLAAGVAKHIVTDAQWAKKLGLPNTGHGLPAPSASGPEPLHVVVSGGEKTFDQLVAETKRGLLITRFWYIRPVDQRKTIVTGMTRDGTFEIVDGEITRGVRNLRFNQSILEALRHAEFSSEQSRTAGYAYQCVVPAVKFHEFHFTSTTDF